MPSFFWRSEILFYRFLLNFPPTSMKDRFRTVIKNYQINRRMFLPAALQQKHLYIYLPQILQRLPTFQATPFHLQHKLTLRLAKIKSPRAIKIYRWRCSMGFEDGFPGKIIVSNNKQFNAY